MIFRFGVFEFDDTSGDLRKAGRLVKLERQPALVLAELLRSSGALVTRDTLRAAVWGDAVHVDYDRGLAYCLSQIRTALGDSGDNPRFVLTVPRRGYRFIAPIERPDIESAPRPLASPPAAAAWRRRLVRAAAAGAAVLLLFLVLWRSAPGGPATPAIVAVSVFDNETGQPELDRPVAALSDAVVARLTTFAPGRLAVVGNSAILRRPRNIRDLKAIAEGVRAEYVVLGQLQRDRTGYRFITHFIRLADEAHLKANRLTFADGNLADLEPAVVAEFERAVAAHVLAPSP